MNCIKIMALSKRAKLLRLRQQTGTSLKQTSERKLETNELLPTARLVADVVAERIEHLIVNGALKVGQKLPSERLLVRQLGVSRTALREGLKQLRARGVIETTHGRGSYVASLCDHQETVPLMRLLGSQPRTLFDLFEMRQLLEPEAARLAAERATPADLFLITRRYNEMVDAHAVRHDPSTHARLDHAFHLAISEASHNTVLVHTLRSLTDLLLSSVFASVNNLYHREPHRRSIDVQHARLYRAILERKPSQARKAASDHIGGISAQLQKIEEEEQQLVRSTLQRGTP
jgi:GntR family transcriptional regulator, glc operon transcriptional activator